MWDCNKCENADSNVCLHCFPTKGEKPPYYKRKKNIDYEGLLKERSEIDVKRCNE